MGLILASLYDAQHDIWALTFRLKVLPLLRPAQYTKIRGFNTYVHLWILYYENH